MSSFSFKEWTAEYTKKMSEGENKPKEKQVGGDHYKKYRIQPIDYIVENNLSFLAGNAVKYITRYKDKNGAEDIRKAIHYLELILEFEYKNESNILKAAQQDNFSVYDYIAKYGGMAHDNCSV